MHHRLPAEQLTGVFVRRWAVGAGRSRVIMERFASRADETAGRLGVDRRRRAQQDLLVSGLDAALAVGDRRIRGQVQWCSGRWPFAELWQEASRKGGS